MPDNPNTQVQQATDVQMSAGTANVPYHRHGGADGPLIPLNNVSGSLPMVTATPTWAPSGSIATSLALNSVTGQIYYYDFTNRVWKSSLVVPFPMRVNSVTSGANITTNTDSFDAVSITALAVGTTIDFSGTPTNFQKMIVRIKDNGTSQTLAYGVSLVAMGVTPPTATIVGKTATIGFIYDSIATQWGCVAYVHN